MTRCIAVVGMNGTGKTIFGKRLAAKLKLNRIDTDQVFEKLHGDPHAFIGTHGWEMYRRKEEAIVLQSLQPDSVVILSGGAIESAPVRSALKQNAIVIWLQANSKQVHANLQRAKVTRPEFAKGLHHEAVESMLDARTPHYEDVADIALFPSTPFARQLPVALRELEKFLKSPHHDRKPHSC